MAATVEAMVEATEAAMAEAMEATVASVLLSQATVEATEAAMAEAMGAAMEAAAEVTEEAMVEATANKPHACREPIGISAFIRSVSVTGLSLPLLCSLLSPCHAPNTVCPVSPCRPCFLSRRLGGTATDIAGLRSNAPTSRFSGGRCEKYMATLPPPTGRFDSARSDGQLNSFSR